MLKSRTENNRAHFKTTKCTDHSIPNSVFEFASLKTVVAGEEYNYICLELSKTELTPGKMVLPWVLTPKKIMGLLEEESDCMPPQPSR